MNGFWGETKESGYVIGVRNAEAYEREDSEFGGKFTGRGDRELCIRFILGEGCVDVEK